jgi:hypothetical protein
VFAKGFLILSFCGSFMSQSLEISIKIYDFLILDMTYVKEKTPIRRAFTTIDTETITGNERLKMQENAFAKIL